MKFSLNTLRFEDIRQQTIERLKATGKYNAQFDFAGSNIAYMIDTMAYTTMLLSYNAAHAANNIFLDTTEIRKNAVSIAKTMGYRPMRKRAAKFRIRVEKTGSMYTPQTDFTSLTIPQGLIFVGTNTKLKFITLTPTVFLYESPVKASAIMEVTQGEWTQYSFLGTGKSLQSQVVPDYDIDENNLQLYVHPSDIPSTSFTDIQYLWKESKTFFDIDSSNNAYFIEEDITNEMRPKIIFGNGTIGNIPTSVQTITLKYLKTKGILGNNETELTYTLNDPFTFTDMTLTPINVSYGGAEYEDIESIRNSAPKFYSAAGRGVTSNDIASILDNFTSISDSVVIGGDELYPGSRDHLGNSYISATPNISLTDFLNSSIFLDEPFENSIVESIKSNGIIATKKIFNRPSYVYIDAYPEIELSSKMLKSDAELVTLNAKASLTDYYVSELSRMGNNFRKSKLLTALDSVDGVISSDIVFYLYFPLTYDFFYNAKDTSYWLPVVFKKDPDTGERLYDPITQAAITESFLKTNAEIVAEKNDLNSLINGVPYTLANLPPMESSIYGNLTSISGNTKFVYNRDNANYKVFNFTIIPGGDAPPTVSILPFEFYDSLGVARTIKFVNISTVDSTIFEMKINDVKVAQIVFAYADGEFDQDGITYEYEGTVKKIFSLYGMNDLVFTKISDAGTVGVAATEVYNVYSEVFGVMSQLKMQEYATPITFLETIPSNSDVPVITITELNTIFSLGTTPIFPINDGIQYDLNYGVGPTGAPNKVGDLVYKYEKYSLQSSKLTAIDNVIYLPDESNVTLYPTYIITDTGTFEDLGTMSAYDIVFNDHLTWRKTTEISVVAGSPSVSSYFPTGTYKGIWNGSGGVLVPPTYPTTVDVAPIDGDFYVIKDWGNYDDGSTNGINFYNWDVLRYDGAAWSKISSGFSDAMKTKYVLAGDLTPEVGVITSPAASFRYNTYKIASPGMVETGDSDTSFWVEANEFIAYAGTDPFVPTVERWFKATDVYQLTTTTGYETYLNNNGYQAIGTGLSNLTGNTLTLMGLYNNSVLANFRYDTGEVKFNKTITGTTDGTTEIFTPIKQLFYGSTDINLITLTPKEGFIDFDTRFNQKLIMNINEIQSKVV